jgi:predicted nucleic acid-binding protein
MKHLFDASSIINLCAKKRVDTLLEGGALGLAFYEAGNAIWRQVYLRKSLTPAEGRKALITLEAVLKVMGVVSVEHGPAVLDIAIEGGLTYYDASYIHAAVKNGLTLVTDDERLFSVAKRYVSTATSQDIAQQE